MSDSSDDDMSGFISPSSIRPSMRRDVGMGSARQSTIVKAAARRQLRGDSDKKPVKEVAAEYRKKFQTEGQDGQDMSRSSPPDHSRSPASQTTPFHGNELFSAHLRNVVVRRRGGGTSNGNSKNVGIGIKFREQNGQHIVTSLLPDGPAQQTGEVFEGDVMEAVNDVPLAGKSSDEVIDLILGPPGEDVLLTMRGQKQEELSPSIQQTPVGPSNHISGNSGITADLKSADSPASREFELVSPGQAELGSTAARKCSVGLRFVMNKKMRAIVHQIVPGMAADESKRIHVGDILVRVDGVDVGSKEASAIESLLAGPPGSPVSLTVESSHDRERRSVRLTRTETVSGPFIISEPQENVDDITPAPLEPSPEVARRPGPPESVSLESDDDRIVAEIEAGPNRRFHEMEDRLAKLEKKMDKKHDSSKELGGQISNLQTSIDKRFASQERTLSQLKDKIDKSPKCACVVS